MSKNKMLRVIFPNLEFIIKQKDLDIMRPMLVKTNDIFSIKPLRSLEFRDEARKSVPSVPSPPLKDNGLTIIPDQVISKKAVSKYTSLH